MPSKRTSIPASFIDGDVELFVNAFGEHHFKAGYDRENLSTDATSSYTGNSHTRTRTRVPPATSTSRRRTTLYVTGRTFINGGVFTSRNEAFYLQDSWSLFDNRLEAQPRLSVTTGSQNKNVAGQTYYKSGNQWQRPRLAATFDPLR